MRWAAQQSEEAAAQVRPGAKPVGAASSPISLGDQLGTFPGSSQRRQQYCTVGEDLVASRDRTGEKQRRRMWQTDGGRRAAQNQRSFHGAEGAWSLVLDLCRRTAHVVSVSIAKAFELIILESLQIKEAGIQTDPMSDVL